MPPAIHAIAEGLRAAGVRLVTNHPGFFSQSLATAFHGQETITSINEKTAFAVAWGAAAGGCRSAVSLKNVGLNDAADPFLNSFMLDINAALVVVVFDDTDVEQSQLRLDSRHYHAFLGGLWLEPGTQDEAAEFAAWAVELSERFCTPVVLRVTNRLLAEDSPARFQDPITGSPRGAEFCRKPEALVVHPANFHRHQRASWSEKRRLIERWAASEFLVRNPAATPDDAGRVHLVVGSARTPSVSGGSVLHLPMLPVPSMQILGLVHDAHGLIVHEHGDAVVAEALRSASSPLGRIGSVSSGAEEPNRSFHNSDSLASVYAALRGLPRPIVVGDVGGHTMDPARSVDACLCYGSSVAVAIGMALACPQSDVACVTGDGAWVHGASSAIGEAVARGVRFMVVVLHNGGCQSTGGQMPPHFGSLPAEVRQFFPELPSGGAFSWKELLQAPAALPGVKVLHLELRE